MPRLSFPSQGPHPARRGLSLLAALLSAPVAGQEARPDIVVTGRGLADAAGERAYDTVVIDRAAIRANAADRLESVLGEVAGLDQFRRSDSRSANPTSQGITLRGLGGNAASRALLILDGVPQADPFGGWVAFPAYALSRLGEIRVTRGGGSGLYGPGALAGTVVLESATPDQLAPLSAEMAGGSRESVDAQGTAALVRPGGFLTATGVYARGAGFVPTVADDRGPVADATAANPALRPEHLWGGEVGADWTPLSRVRLSATLFDNRLTGAIANVTVGQGPGTYPLVGFVAAGGAFRVRENLDAIRARGAEVDARWTAGSWSLAASYAHTSSRVEASDAAAGLNGLRPAQTPLDQVSGTLGWAKRGAVLSATVRYVAAQFDDDGNTRRLAPATTLDTRAALPVARGWSVELRGENLTDARVEAGTSGAGVIERATPRTLWLGVDYRWR